MALPAAAAAVPAAVPYVAAGLEALFNWFSTDSTNESNEYINERSLAHDKAKTQYLTRFQNYLTARNEWYNSPQHQVEMLREAGLNPLITDSNTPGNAVSPSSAPSAGGTPSQIPMQNPMQGASPILGHLAELSQIKAQNANNNSQAFAKLVESIPTLAKFLGSDAVREMMSQQLPQIIHNNYSSSQASRLIEREIVSADLKNSLDDFNLHLQEKYGEDLEYRKIIDLEQKAAESVVRCGLYNTLASLNESNVEVNEKKMVSLVAQAYKDFKAGSLYAAKALSEDELRELFVNQLRLSVVNDALSTIENVADFEENSSVRAFKESDKGKVNKKLSYTANNNGMADHTERVLGLLDRAVKIAVPFAPAVRGTSSPGYSAPWQTRYAKRRSTRLNAQGYKESSEWYQPYNP